ncbi:WhiB family transcriptional regulator [Streptomyces luteireticuli]|uniref:WhiB family transcriptional regulator n=1 Tax=Streptomyces luteireticuli TaxID=173858 RepID=UPI00355874C9
MSTQSWDPYWRQHGACTHRQSDGLFFAHQGSAYQEEAVQICRRCAVATECLAYALDARVPEGVYGGATAQWRRELLARRPDVVSWRDLLERARAEARSKESVRCSRSSAAAGEGLVAHRRGGDQGTVVGREQEH